MYKHGESSKRIYSEEQQQPSKRLRFGGEASSSTSTATQAVGRAGYSGTTRVLMFDGSTREIRTLQNGDVLLGDDGTPRTIARVTPFNGSLRQLDIVATGNCTVQWDAERNAFVIEYLDSNNVRRKKQFTVNPGANERNYATYEDALTAARAFADNVDDKSPRSQDMFIDNINHRQFITPVQGGYVVYTAGEQRIECSIYDAITFNIPRDFRRRHGLKVAFPTIKIHCRNAHEAFDQAQLKNDELATSKFAESVTASELSARSTRDSHFKVYPFYPGLYLERKGPTRNQITYSYEYTNRQQRKIATRFHITDRIFYETREQAEAAVTAYQQHLQNNGEMTIRGEINYMTLNEYQNYQQSTRRLWLLFRTGLEFGEQALTVDPYYLGLWLGDGSRSRPEIANNHEQEIVEFLRRYSEKLSMRLVNYSNSLTYAIVRNNNGESDIINPTLSTEQQEQLQQVTRSLESYNPNTRILTDLPPAVRANSNRLLDALRELQVTALRGTGPQADRKHIPNQYKFNSRMNRLLLIAGLIDSDGSYYNREHRFVFSQSKRWHERLLNDMVWVSRSLGFSVYDTERWKESNPPGSTHPIVTETLFANVKGFIEEVPCLLQRKQPGLRLTVRDPLVSSIRNTGPPMENQQCFELTVLGADKKFLRFDFVVLHDSSHAQ